VVLNPLKAGHNRIVMLLPAVRSILAECRFDIWFQTPAERITGRAADLEFIAQMHENQTLAEVWSNVKEPPPSKSVEASKITIDGVCISVEIGQQSWWARASRNILISFSLEEANSKVDECSKIPKHDSKDNAQDLPAVVIISNTSVGKSSLIEEVVGYNRCLLRSGGSRLRQGLE
jgi:hypothetical protein